MKFFNRSKIQRISQVVATLILTTLLVACGGGEKQAKERSQDQQPSSVAQEAAAASTGTLINGLARDFEFNLDSVNAPAGTVTFVIRNEGAMPHDFAITIGGERHKTEMIQPGSSASLTVDVEAGTYEYICTIPGHDMLGMKGTFTVN